MKTIWQKACAWTDSPRHSLPILAVIVGGCWLMAWHWNAKELWILGAVILVIGGVIILVEDIGRRIE